ncbi:uncharacterized protein LOC128994119 [Macrosteles quadrilineatus]|uniref:uncharacterized protein LOC128994119 n=1 Tax=Macrosteles quadrilineatus TaxID=74068 RepID=UPI0023E31617|nr:uncharacterized protein LOC128994119 [Macrosteles quadrilineatus]
MKNCMPGCVMFKMFLLFAIFIVSTLAEEEKESPLFSLKRRLVDYYANPPQTGSEVLCSAVFYLHELTRLQEALTEKAHQKTAKDLLVKLDEDGGPKHLNKIPYNKFIDLYTWEGEEISNYHTIVTHTRRVWDELRVDVLGKEEVFTGPEDDGED